MALDALFTELEPISPEQVALTMAGNAAARIAGRAAFLGHMSADGAARSAAARDWQVFLVSELEPTKLAELVRAEPWLPPARHGLSFCTWLVGQGVLEQEQLDGLHARSLELGWPIFQVAMDEALIDEEHYVSELSRFFNLSLADPPLRIPRSLLVSFPVGWVEHFELVPLRLNEDSVEVAVASPLPASLLERLRHDAGRDVDQQLAAPAAVASWRRRWLRHWWKLHHANWGHGDVGPGSLP